MTLTQLIYVVKIADTKSMNKAAAELYVSQPALSSAVKDEEYAVKRDWKRVCTDSKKIRRDRNNPAQLVGF